MSTLGFRKVHAEPVTVPVWRRLAEEATLDGAPLAVAALGGSPSTPEAGVTAEVLRVASLEELAASGDAARGKIVFFDAPIARARDGSGYGAGAKVRVLGPVAAAGKGALAVVLRSIGTANDDAPHTGVTKDPEAGSTAIPSAALGAESATRLARTLAAGGSHRLTLRLRTERAPDATSANVVGDVPGTDPAASGVVLLGAHLDSWDLGRGAADDGCGVGAVLDAAAGIARAGGARRTVRVVLFAAEENSGAGAKAYAAAHATEPHLSATEMDAGCGAAYEVRVLAGDGPATRSLRGAIASAVAPVPLGDKSAEGGADVQPLRALGVPIVDVRQDMSAYFDVHHTRLDVADAIAADELRAAARTLSAVTWAVASATTELLPVPEERRKRSF